MQRLLIVDDNADHRLILRTMFEAQGYECEEAFNGAEALIRLNATLITLVLTDLHMPGMNGLELVNQMQAFAWMRNIPVIVLTSQLRDEISKKAYTSRARAVLPKPYDFSKLLAEVSCAIRQSESSVLTTMA